MAVNALKLIGVLLALVAGLYLIVKLASLVVPFIVAFLIASMVEPLVHALDKRLHLTRTIATTVTVLLVLALLFTVVGVVAVKLASEARDFALQLPAMYTDWANAAQKFMTELDVKYEFIDQDAINTINDVVLRLRGELLGLVNTATKSAWGIAASTPRMIVTLIVTLLATFFFTRDRDYISRQIHRQLPESWIRRVESVRDDLFGALFGYIRAMLILMLVTFVELTIGFTLVGVNYAILFALIISIFDALPVLGTGTFVVPWALYNLLTGNVPTAVGLLLVFCVVWMVRQLLEPRVVGDQIGIHPLLTLVSMYIGMRYMGVFGMILGPVTLIIVRNLFSVYSRGRTLREMLYQGVEMPEEERIKDSALEETGGGDMSFINRALTRIADFLSSIFSKKK